MSDSTTSMALVLIAKTTAELAAEARAFLEREHSYDVPAILTLPLSDMNAAYRDWLLGNICRGGGAAPAAR